MQSDAEILEILNDVLTAELTAINQYFIHAKMCDNWGYHRLAEHGRHESIDEMKHADIVIDRILYFDGTPNMQRLYPVRVGETVAEQLQLDVELEYAAVERLNDGIAVCVDEGRQRHARAARRHPRVGGGPHRLAGDAAGDDPPDRPRGLPRPAAVRLSRAPPGARPLASRGSTAVPSSTFRSHPDDQTSRSRGDFRPSGTGIRLSTAGAAPERLPAGRGLRSATT